MEKALTHERGMLRQCMKNHAASLMIAALCLLVSSGQFAYPGIVSFWKSWEWGLWDWSQRFPYLLQDFKNVFLSGTPYPRWLPDLMGGNGYPTFVFYQPGAFFLALPFALLVDPILATKLTVLLMLLIGGFGAFRLCRLFVSPAAALAATALFLLHPYLLISYYIRHTYAEILGMMVFPWCLYFAVRLAREWPVAPTLKPALGFAVSLGALFLAHPFVTIHAAPLLALVMLAHWGQTRFSARLALVWLLCLLLGLVIASPYLIGVLQLRGSINYEGIQFTYLTWLQPLGRLLQANALSTLLVLLGLWRVRRTPLGWALAAMFLWVIFINTQYAFKLWQHYPLRLTQSPIRSLAGDIELRLLATAFAFAQLEQWAQRFRRGIWLLPAAVLAATAAMALNPMPMPVDARIPFTFAELQKRWHDSGVTTHRRHTLERYNDESLKYDFLPKQIDLRKLKKEPPYSRPLFWESPPGALGIAPAEGANLPYRFDINVTVPKTRTGAPLSLHLRQFYLPGWKLEVNGLALPEHILSPDLSWRWQPGADGRIQLQFLVPGKYKLRAWYDGPPHAAYRNGIMLLLGLLLCWLLAKLTIRPTICKSTI